MNNNVLQAVPLTFQSIPEEITKIMVELGHPDPESWKQTLDPRAFSAATHEEQRFYTNRVWRQILSDLPIEELDRTRHARTCLVDTFCETVDYLRFFRDEVIPCAIRLGLGHKTN